MFDTELAMEPSDLRENIVRESERAQQLVFGVPQKLVFDLHWLREVSVGSLQADLGLTIDVGAEVSVQLTLTGSFHKVISHDEERWLRLKVLKREGRKFVSSISATAQIRAQSPDEPGEMVLALGDEIYRKAATALERKLEAEVSRLYESVTEEMALLDCSFSLTEEGLSLYRRATAGDYTWILARQNSHVRIHRAVLTHELTRGTNIELHLPFLNRKQWLVRSEVAAKMEVEAEDNGRLLVYHADASNRTASKNHYQTTLALAAGLLLRRVHTTTNFTLSHTDTWRLPSAGASLALSSAVRAYGFSSDVEQWLTELGETLPVGCLEASLTLLVPGSLASAWVDAPGERSPSFFQVYSRVSVAVQRALRWWLPYVYFKNLDRYDNTVTASPMLVYQSSRPFEGRPKNDFTYDLMGEDWRGPFFRSAARQLPKELGHVQELLLALGMKKAAALYSPRRADAIVGSAAKQTRLVGALLAADTFLVDALVNLGCRASRLRETFERSPQEAVKDLLNSSTSLAKTLNRRLRRLYGGQDFSSLGSLVLVEATNALREDACESSAVQAVLRVTCGRSGGSGSVTQTFVNSTFRP